MTTTLATAATIAILMAFAYLADFLAPANALIGG